MLWEKCGVRLRWGAVGTRSSLCPWNYSLERIQLITRCGCSWTKYQRAGENSAIRTQRRGRSWCWEGGQSKDGSRSTPRTKWVFTGGKGLNRRTQTRSSVFSTSSWPVLPVTANKVENLMAPLSHTPKRTLLYTYLWLLGFFLLAD